MLCMPTVFDGGDDQAAGLFKGVRPTHLPVGLPVCWQILLGFMANGLDAGVQHDPGLDLVLH